MTVLVTGGSGVIGEGVVAALLEHDAHVRVLTRHAERDARRWPDRVEPFPADVTEPGQLPGAADGCEAIVHVTGIVAETPPENTFQRVNVDGTRHLLSEATRSGRPRFVFISSLGADRGASDYHASKRAAEELVRGYDGEWIILRPGNVYGPGDDVISLLLNMHRTLPALPVIGTGRHPFQPIWYRDLGEAVARAVTRPIAKGTYALAGSEVTTPEDVLDHFERLTGRAPMRVPVPEAVAGVATWLSQAAGVPFPIGEAQFEMLLEHNVVEPPEENALSTLFEVPATPLSQGLAILADVQPEQPSSEGVGSMERKRFWADISDSRFDAVALLEAFRERCFELLPIEFGCEPGSGQDVVEGATLTAALPMRGNIQVRVASVRPDAIVFATVRGHPLAGVVQFTTSEPAAGTVRFEIIIHARAASIADWLLMTAGGSMAQASTWRTTVKRVIDLSGGSSDGVQHEAEVLADADSADAEAWMDGLIANQKRAAHGTGAANS